MCVIRIIMTQSNVSSILPQVAPFSHPSVFPWKSQNQNPHSSHPTTIESLYVCVLVEKKNKKRCVRLSVFVIVKQRRRRELHGERKNEIHSQKKRNCAAQQKTTTTRATKTHFFHSISSFHALLHARRRKRRRWVELFSPTHTNTHAHTLHSQQKTWKNYLLAVKKRHKNTQIWVSFSFPRLIFGEFHNLIEVFLSLFRG